MWQNEWNVHFLDYIVINSLIAINVIADSIKLCHLPRAFCPRQDFDSWSFSVHSGIIWPAANYAWCIKLQRQLTVQLQIYPLICCKLTQMIKLLNWKYNQTQNWFEWLTVIFVKQPNQGLKLYFLDLITVLLAIYQCLLKSQKWIRRSSLFIMYSSQNDF